MRLRTFSTNASKKTTTSIPHMRLLFTKWHLALFSCLCALVSHSQIIINEASNQNYASVTDEDSDNPDWLELYNAGTEAVNLEGYSLTDDIAFPSLWTFPNHILLPGEFLLVHCSEKDRFATTPGTLVTNAGSFVPQFGWNTHEFQTPFYWDGVSNIMINVCSYSSLGYTSNSVFNQSYTPYLSSLSAVADGSPSACGSNTGWPVNLRPNLLLNGLQIGTGVVQNCTECYPAPYGNWYWGARNQMIIHADELIAAGLVEGTIDSLAFDVVSPDPQTYDYIEIIMNNADLFEYENTFIVNDGLKYHTNFKISSEGETVYLFSPDELLADSIDVFAESFDVSNGSFPDGGATTVMFQTPTPGATNSFSEPADGYATEPVISIGSGFFSQPFFATISNLNGPTSDVYYTLDGSLPDTSSILYEGMPISIAENTILRARAFESNHLASDAASASYFFNVNHSTPIISVITDNENLYGPEGIFDNFMDNWLKDAHVEYFDSIPTHPLLFSQESGMIQDGGWGGSRSQPQHSFRLKLADNVLGGDPMLYPVIPDRGFRNQYSDFYMRNGSNQFLTLPYKDAAQVKMMCAETNSYYSAFRPASVYINGQYFGLYELREKWNKEKFIIEDNATEETIELLSLSAYFGYVLRAVEGDVDNYWNDLNALNALDPASPDYIEEADQYFDMKYYTDYIIGETWMGNTDWPGNNIKIYRSDATDNRWRFCTIDLELSLQPNGWTDCNTDVLAQVIGIGEGNPFVSTFNRSIQNPAYRNFFVNRYADILNTAYQTDRLLAVEQNFYDQMVDEMPNEYARWADPNNVEGSMQGFADNHQIFRDELECRNTVIRDQIQNNFQLTDQINVTLNVFPEGAGTIQINTIIPESLPWTGIYFNGIPVTMTAIANPGYVFGSWSSENILTSPFTNSELTININLDDSFTALFIGLPEQTKVTISEINYNSEETQFSGDWFELHNYGIATVNLSGWKISNQFAMPIYTIPSGTILYPGQYLVFAHDMASFQTQFPEVENVIGPFVFNLEGDGGTIRITNPFNEEFLSVTYDDINPWPMVADGGGRTLERGSNTNDPNLSESWFAGCMLGSPGEAHEPCTEKIIFSEINYESSPTANAGEWVELRNISDETVDISNWMFRDSEFNQELLIPDNTILSSGEMIVLCSNTALFNQQFPLVSNVLGNFAFGLDNSGELIRLYDSTNKLAYSMHYASNTSWPQTPNGGGYTLELIDSSANANDATNWMAGCLYGSPGVNFTPCLIDFVNENSGDKRLLVYPNPSKGSISMVSPIALSPNTVVQITDVFGKIILSETLSTSKTHFNFNLESFATGWYFIQTSGAEGTMGIKVMKD
jgi:hypothetical protein